MQRYLIPAAIGAAFLALMLSPTKGKADEPVEMTAVRIVCDKRTIEEHLALILEDPTYKLVRERLAGDMDAGKCIQTPPMMVPVMAQGRQVTFTDSDGDVFLVTVVQIGPDMWTLAGKRIGKGS